MGVGNTAGAGAYTTRPASTAAASGQWDNPGPSMPMPLT
jgi:hypothetical protein